MKKTTINTITNFLLGLYIATYIAIPANGVDEILGINIHPIILALALLTWMFKPSRINRMSVKYIGLQLALYFAFIISSFLFLAPNYYGQTMNYVYNILFILLLCQVPQKDNINYFLSFFVYGALLNALLIKFGDLIGLQVIHYGGADNERITILGRDDNEMAMIQCFAIAMALYLFRKREHVAIDLVAIVMSAWVILSTGSRTGTIAFLLLIAYNVLSGQRTFKNRFIQIIVSVLIVVAGYYFYTQLGDSITERYMNIGNELEEGTLASRTLIWEKCVETFMNANFFNKLIGHGYGTTTLHTFSGYDAHNVFLKVLVEYGIIGEVIFLIYLSFFIRSAVKIKIKEERFLILATFLMIFISFLTLSWIYNIIIWMVFILLHQKIRFQEAS